MTRSTEGLRNPAARLPDLSLPNAADAAPVRIRQGRRAPVLFVSHGPDCEDCAAYAGRLADVGEEITGWDGRLIRVVPAPPTQTDGDGASAEHDDGSLPTLVDADGRIAAAAGVDAPAVIVADQWGEVQEAYPAEAGHRLVDPQRVVDAVQYVSIHCPECEGEAL